MSEWLSNLLDLGAIRAEKARRSLLAFIRHTMPDYQVGWHHRLLCEHLDRMLRGDLRRLIVSMPPRAGKTEIVSRRFPAYVLGKNPDARVIACSYSADLASRNNRDVQRIMDGPAYRALFPDTRLPGSPGTKGKTGYVRTSDLFEVVGRSGSYRSAGVGGGITGMGGNFLVLDDPFKNREEADSPTVREAVWEWYTSTLYTRQEPGACILVCMTRWNRDDIVGRLLARAEEDSRADQWSVLTFPAIAEEVVEPLDPRQPGEPLWPERFPLDELEKMKASMGAYEWSALYQQNPRPEGGTEWPDSYFPPSIWFTDWPSDLTMRGIGLDPSKGKDAKWGDYSALVKMGRDSQGILYVEADLGRWNTDEITARAVEMCREFRPDMFAIEANQFQELLATQIARAGRQSGMPLPVVPMVNTVKKEVRIRRLTPYLAQGVMRFKGGSPGTRLLVQQLKDFPLGDHDDGADGAELVLRALIDLDNGRRGKRGPTRIKS